MGYDASIHVVEVRGLPSGAQAALRTILQSMATLGVHGWRSYTTQLH